MGARHEFGRARELGSLLALISGVLFRPSLTLRVVCRVRPLGWATLVALVAGVALAVANLATLPSDLPSGPGAPVVTLKAAVLLTFVALAPLVGLVGLALAAAVYHVAAVRLGGQASLKGVFSGLAFGLIPWLFSPPLALLFLVPGPAGPLFQALGMVGGLALLGWVGWLHLLAVRENYGFTTARAAVTYLLPPLVVLTVLGVVALLVMFLVFLVMRGLG